MKKLFSIQQSNCYYKDSQNNKFIEVLNINNQIDELIIPREKITIIVGASGSGKSTFLETLGIMNNTIQPNPKGSSSIKFEQPEAKGGVYTKDYINDEIWNDKIFTERIDIRNVHMSFIFQETNLMPNFSAIDNVCITDMVKGGGSPYLCSYMKALIIFLDLELGHLPIEVSPKNISGGERQRIAFARAIVPEFNILFGDEPTGNLDHRNSTEVMSILKEYIDHDKKSAIIVSHDLNLALYFADRIILLNKNLINGLGEIQKKNIFDRDKNVEAEDILKANNNCLNAKSETHKLFDPFKENILSFCDKKHINLFRQDVTETRVFCDYKKEINSLFKDEMKSKRINEIIKKNKNVLITFKKITSIIYTKAIINYLIENFESRDDISEEIHEIVNRLKGTYEFNLSEYITLYFNDLVQTYNLNVEEGIQKTISAICKRLFEDISGILKELDQSNIQNTLYQSTDTKKLISQIYDEIFYPIFQDIDKAIKSIDIKKPNGVNFKEDNYDKKIFALLDKLELITANAEMDATLTMEKSSSDFMSFINLKILKKLPFILKEGFIIRIHELIDSLNVEFLKNGLITKKLFDFVNFLFDEEGHDLSRKSTWKSLTKKEYTHEELEHELRTNLR